MTSFLDKCKQYFHTEDFYEILHIDRDVKPKAIKKAYHKVSLIVHPDRVGEEEKEVATEKFKIISKIYSVLSNEDKRKIYDETGDFAEEGGDSLMEWMNLWRSMFKPISIKDIDDYKREYIGSDNERRDILKAYEGTKGSMTKMHEMVPFLDCENEERVIGIVREMVDNDEVAEYKDFFNESKAKKNRRRKNMESKKLTDDECAALEEEYKKRRAERENNFSSFMSNLEKKYNKPAAIKGAKSASSKRKSPKTAKMSPPSKRRATRSNK